MKTRATCCLLLAAIAVACGSGADNGGGPGVTDPDGGAGGDSGGSGGDAGADGSTDGSTLDGGGGDARAPAVGDFCVEDGWCWQRPTPFGTSLFGVWGSAPDDVWAVGTRGTIVHDDGLGWKLVASGSRANLTAVWGTSKTDVWSVGYSGLIRHFDGVTWSAKTSGTAEDLHVVRAFAANDAWAGGANATLLRWNGTAWSAASAPPIATTDGYRAITGFAGTGSSNLWVSTSTGELFHFDGVTWTRSAWLSVGLTALARTPSGALFTAGQNGAIFRRAP